jgi:hypothetical protein
VIVVLGVGVGVVLVVLLSLPQPIMAAVPAVSPSPARNFLREWDLLASNVLIWSLIGELPPVERTAASVLWISG